MEVEYYEKISINTGSWSVHGCFVRKCGAGGEWFADSDSLTRRLQAELSPGVTVLIKGSRINRLERVVQALTGGGAGSGPMTRAS